MAISESRKAMIEEDAKGLGGGGAEYYYVDRQIAEELGLYQYKPKHGDNFIRIVAPNTEDPFRLIVWRHQNVGANGNTYLCMNKMYQDQCPVCDLLARLKLEDPKHPALDQMYAARRVLLFVVDTTDEETEAEGTAWFDCPPAIYQSICDIAKAKRTGETTDVSCPDEGCTISFERKKKKGNPYCGYQMEDPKSIPDEWFSSLPGYEDILLVPEVEEIELQIAGVEPGQRPEKVDKGNSRRRVTHTTGEDAAGSRRRSTSTDNDSTSRRSRRNTQTTDDTSTESRRTHRSEDNPNVPPAEDPGQEEPQQEEKKGGVRSRLDEIRENRLKRNK